MVPSVYTLVCELCVPVVTSGPPLCSHQPMVRSVFPEALNHLSSTVNICGPPRSLVFIFLYFLKMRRNVLPACLLVFLSACLLPLEARKDIGTEVVDSCELPCVCSEN